jgi:hypothetical protein
MLFFIAIHGGSLCSDCHQTAHQALGRPIGRPTPRQGQRSPENYRGSQDLEIGEIAPPIFCASRKFSASVRRVTGSVRLL